MPHFATHLITLEKTIDRLGVIDPNFSTFFRDKDENLKMARWGAIGPDIFFWSFYEKHGGIEGLENTLFLGYKIMEPLEKIKEILEPIEDNLDEIKNFITGGVYEEVERLINTIKALLLTLGVDVVANTFDFLCWFELALAKGETEEQWYWFDMLHYRSTSEFAENLLFLANEEDNVSMKEKLIAFALGYRTHLATDIVGHPYVNRFSGGPYRTQWHRHFIGENMMDTWSWHEYKPDIGECQVEGEADELAFAGINENMEINSNTIKRVSSLFREALGKTYEGSRSPDVIDDEQMASLFAFMLEYMEKATNQGYLNIPTPQEPVVFHAIDELFESPPNIPNRSDEDVEWEDVFRGMVAFISWSIETLLELITLPVALAADLATFPLRWWLYQIELVLYDLYKTLHKLLALQGYVIPFHDEILDPDLTSFRFQPEFSREYPKRRNAPVIPNSSGEPEPIEAPVPPPPSRGHHLKYPESGVEKRTTISSFYLEDEHPSIFIDSSDQDLAEISKTVFKYAKCYSPYQPSSGPILGRLYTDELNKEFSIGSRPMGSASDLGSIFIQKALQEQNLYDVLGVTSDNCTDLSDLNDLDFAKWDFNLDADRGFGWKCWRADSIEPSCAPNEHYCGWNPTKINISKYLKGDD